MNFGFTAKYQSLLTSLILVVTLSIVGAFQACRTDKSQSTDQASIFNPDSLSIISAAQQPETLSATKSDGTLLLTYTGIYDEVVNLRIYNSENSLVYGEKELKLVAGEETRIDFENISSDAYQLIVFFQNGEFLVTEVEISDN